MGFFDKVAKLLLGGDNKEGEEVQINEPSNDVVEEKKEVEKVGSEVSEVDKPETHAPIKSVADKSQNSEEKKEEQVEQKTESEHVANKSVTSNKKETTDAEFQPKQEKKPINELEDDPIQKQDKILKNILAIAQDYRVNHISVDNKALIINVSDQITFNILKNNSFADIVKREIYDQDGLIFGGGIELALKSEVNTLWTEVYSDVYVEVKDGFVADVEEKVNVIKKATIKVIANSGSLLQDIYTLDSAEIKNLPQKRYNIGIGAETLTADKQLRENQIAFDDNPSSPFFASNRYVSRAHAYIAYDESIGFLLYAEKGGTTLGGKRTRIYRDGLDIKLDNTMVPEPLHDGDVIELTKKVKLLFKLIKD